MADEKFQYAAKYQKAELASAPKPTRDRQCVTV